MNSHWTTRATLTTIGGGRVELALDNQKVRVALPVTLPSEEQALAPLLYQPVVISIAAAPAEGKSAEEELAWHRAEVTRLRNLLVEMERGRGVASARVEIGHNWISIIAPTEQGERALLDAILSWIADRGVMNPEVAERVRTAETLAYHAGALAGLTLMTIYLPREGKRLGPAPSEALVRLLKDDPLNEHAQASMRRYLDEHKDELAAATFGVNAKEWSGGEAGDAAEPERGTDTLEEPDSTSPHAPPREYRIRTRFGQLGTLREQDLGPDKGYQIEFQPDAGGPPVSFVGMVWSRGAEEDSVRMDLDGQYVAPLARARWATWKTSPGERGTPRSSLRATRTDRPGPAALPALPVGVGGARRCG